GRGRILVARGTVYAPCSQTAPLDTDRCRSPSLTASRNIADDRGGPLTARAVTLLSPGQSLFTLSSRSYPTVAQRFRERSTRTQGLPGASGMKILIAENDHVSGLFLRRTLEKLNHEVDIAKDGREAWQQFQAKPYQMVISDGR